MAPRGRARLADGDARGVGPPVRRPGPEADHRKGEYLGRLAGTLHFPDEGGGGLVGADQDHGLGVGGGDGLDPGSDIDGVLPKAPLLVRPGCAFLGVFHPGQASPSKASFW